MKKLIINIGLALALCMFIQPAFAQKADFGLDDFGLGDFSFDVGIDGSSLDYDVDAFSFDYDIGKNFEMGLEAGVSLDYESLVPDFNLDAMFNFNIGDTVMGTVEDLYNPIYDSVSNFVDTYKPIHESISNVVGTIETGIDPYKYSDFLDYNSYFNDFNNYAYGQYIDTSFSDFNYLNDFNLNTSYIDTGNINANVGIDTFNADTYLDVNNGYINADFISGTFGDDYL